MGGGIVGLPRAFYFLGIPLAIFLNLLCVILMIYSVRLYLAMKDACPEQPESLYEIGYLIIGRPAIFILGFIYFIASLGLCMIYFITYGDTLGQLVASIVGEEFDSIWYTQRWFYILILTGLLTPVVLQKDLAELEWISVVLFICLGLFIILCFIELVFDSNFKAPPIEDDIWYPNVKDPSTIGALQILTLAYAY